jgi:hypothetical protein
MSAAISVAKRSRKWQAQYESLTIGSGGKLIGFAEISDGEWDVCFSPLRLGRFQERTHVIEGALGRQKRRRPHC